MDFPSSIHYLAENHFKNVNSPDISEKIDIISSRPYSLDLLKKEHRPTDIQINTSGAYLWGCSQNYYGDVSKFCSPLCLNSLGNLKTEKCQYSVWVYTPNLTNIYSTSTSKAYIFVPENWEIFKKEEILQLKEKGIVSAAILKTQNSIHRFYLPVTSIDELPLSNNEAYGLKDPQTETKNDHLLLYLLFAGFLLFLLIRPFYVSFF